jgi:hypothetical protein
MDHSVRINVLTPGFTTSNGSAFLFPFVVHKTALRESSISVRFVQQDTPGITDCDVLAIDSKEFRLGWDDRKNQTLDLLASYRDSGTKILWFDTTDSTGTLQTSVLEIVDKYFKSQLLVDKSRYTEVIYGGREHSDFYNNNAGIFDENEDALNDPISAQNISKLGVSWNSGLSDYSTYGPWKISLYRRIPISPLLRHPRPSRSPTSSRSNNLSARFGATYSRATVRYQREQIRNLLNKQLDTTKLNRRGYMKELTNSKVVLSPFGWGEITLKDFEVFLTGGMLLKPSMDHLETWPNFYKTNETYLDHNWELSNLNEKIEWAITHDSSRQEIAEQGQLEYSKYTSGPDSGELFTAHLHELISS